MFDCSPVFYANYQSKAKVVINQGGSSSSKTYSIIQLLFLRAKETERLVITVAGQDIPNLKKGAYRDAETIYAKSAELRSHIQFWNKSERIIYFKNGSIIEFNSYENEQDARSGKRDILFVNEVNGVEWIVFFQLAIRTRGQIFLDYNPSVAFFVHERLIGTTPEQNDLSASVQLIISDHRHNPFLSEEEHRKIEGIKDRQLWLVYARGKTGNITGLIFPDWQRIPDKDFPKDAPFFGGLDFGFTNDPTAGVKIARVGESIFIHEMCYTPGMSMTQVKQLFWANGFNGNHPVYCDHVPENVAELRRNGVLALAARKGQGSINAGIIKLKEYKVFYTESSANLHIEKSKYMWMTDPATGKSTNAPIDAHNHCIDAIRMGVFTHFFRS